MIVIVGMAGAGKSTQCRRLASEKGLQWLAVGEVLRARETGPERAEMIGGKVLDDTIVTPVVDAEIKRLGDSPEILLDGCPRTKGQAHWLANQSSPATRLVIHLVISDKEALRRLTLRGREDDTEEAMKLRFAGYHRDIGPVLDEFRHQNIPVIDINADADQDSVYAQILERIS